MAWWWSMAKKGGKSPACPIFVRDYMADEDVVLMDLEQEGAYLRLLFYQWLEGTVPDDIESLARMCRTTPQRMRRIWKRVGVKFESAGPGRLRNATLERVRAESKAYQNKMAENGRKGAASRWGKDGKANGKANGNATAESSPAVAVALPPSNEGGCTEGHRGGGMTRLGTIDLNAYRQGTDG